MMKAFIVILAAALTALAAPALAQDPAAGRKLAATVCHTCHGVDGIGRSPDVPHIGGESTFYLEKQLHAFASGERTHPQMTIIAAGLSEQDIRDVAAWYSRIILRATEPRL